MPGSEALRAFDKGSPDPNVVITFDITNSIIHVTDGGDPVLTDYDPADLHINYSSLAEPWSHPGSGTGNLDAQPLFVDATANHYQLDSNSPAIDAGDPTAGWDADGTRIEMGYYDHAQSFVLAGDLDHDGIVNADDIDLLALAIRQGMTAPPFDLDDNGLVDDDDFQYLIQNILQTTAGDANLDGLFNSSDMVEVFQSGEYEDDLEGNSGWARGDWDGDGDFTSADMVAAFQAGSYEQPAAAAAPTSWSQQLSAAIDAVWQEREEMRRRRR